MWRAFAYAIGLFVFCFTAAFAIGNDKKVSVVVPVVALILVVAALALMRVLQTRVFISMLLAPCSVTWPDQAAVLQQFHLGPLVAAASVTDAVVVFRLAVGTTMLTGMPVADVHGRNLGQQAVLRAIVTGPERSFDQDPQLAFRLLADIARRSTTRRPQCRPLTRSRTCSPCSPPGPERPAR